jgi:hypothetical protein
MDGRVHARIDSQAKVRGRARVGLWWGRPERRGSTGAEGAWVAVQKHLVSALHFTVGACLFEGIHPCMQLIVASRHTRCWATLPVDQHAQQRELHSKRRPAT